MIYLSFLFFFFDSRYMLLVSYHRVFNLLCIKIYKNHKKQQICCFAGHFPIFKYLNAKQIKYPRFTTKPHLSAIKQKKPHGNIVRSFLVRTGPRSASQCREKREKRLPVTWGLTAPCAVKSL